VAELIYGSEVKQDSRCPQCGAHEQYHVHAATPPEKEESCPFCGYGCSIWIDRYSSPSWRGCQHVRDIVVDTGGLKLQFDGSKK
jgi:hypothetical protein